MLLRASGQRNNETFDLQAVTAERGDGGVQDGETLRALTEATIRSEWLELSAMRSRAEARIGTQVVVDTLIVAAAFNGITRVADSTGIPLDDNTAVTTEDLRADTGIDNFSYGVKSERYDAGVGD